MNLSVYILCHNRTGFAKAAIFSALAQVCSDFKLIVSDSSDEAALEDFCSRFAGVLTYRRRPSSLTFLQHINSCIEECKTEYICLFHDDDLMYPSFTRTIARLISDEPEFSGYAVNAEVYRSGKPSETSLLWPQTQRRVRGSSALARVYFANAQLGFPPFPAYVYKRAHLKTCLPKEEMGKYLDVFILMRLADYHGLLWSSRVGMLYRIHGDNDGLWESTKDRRRLIQKIRPLIGKDSQDSLNGLRRITYKNWLQEKSVALTEARRRRIKGLLSITDRRNKLSLQYWTNKALKTYFTWNQHRIGL